MPFLQVYEQLLAHHGHQQWWPGETPFEVMVGAVLTQNTAWSNVEKAIACLKAAGALSPETIVAAEHERLAGWIRPSGYFNVKAQRLKNYCTWYLEQGGFDALQRWPTVGLRRAVLGVNGIGPETADDIVLYGFGRPVFVIDTYTRRLFTRLGLIRGDEDYETLRARFEAELAETADPVAVFNEYHALIVAHAKDFCRKTQRCEGCCLADRCAGADVPS